MSGNTDNEVSCELDAGEPAPALHEGRIDDFIRTGRIGASDLHIFIAPVPGDERAGSTSLAPVIDGLRKATDGGAAAGNVRLLGIDARGGICNCLGDGAPTESSAGIVFLSLCLPASLDAAPFDAFRRRLQQDLSALMAGPGACRVAVAPDVRRTLEFSLPDVGAARAQLPTASPAAPPHPYAPEYDGTGVIVACIDFGCDFAHANFRRADGSTRLIALWDQNEGDLGPVVDPTAPTPRPAAPCDFGRAFGAGLLDAALATEDPYYALGYDPHANYYLDEIVGGAHGTHVLDVAAGNGRARTSRPEPAANRPMRAAPEPLLPKAPGVAPNADLLFVQVAQPRLSEGRRVLSAGRLLEALAWVFRTADARGQPVVANLSLSTNSGPHDGTGLFDIAIECLLRKPGRAVVIAAGNARDEALHARGAIAPGSSRTLIWQIHPQDRTRNDIEIWSDAPVDLTVSLTPPGGKPLPTVQPGEHRTIVCAGRHIGDVFGSRPRSPGTTRFIRISLHPFENAGDWRITLAQASTPDAQSPVIVAFDAWVERDDQGQSRFAAADASQAQTLGTFACSEAAIVVGAYHGLLPGRDAASFSSEGPTRTGGEKPDVVAPGLDVFAAKSKGFKPLQAGARWRSAARVPMSGTSVAAPHVAGIVALMLQKKPEACADEIRRVLRETAHPAGRDWHPRLGCGRVSARDALERL